MGTPPWRVAGGSLAEGHDGHQHSAARARHPDAIGLAGAVQIAAASVFLREGGERGEGRHERECNAIRLVRSEGCRRRVFLRRVLVSFKWLGLLFQP